jgi:hypothetical protein
MSELSQRARELAEQMGGQDHGEEFSFPSMVNLKVIEQGPYDTRGGSRPTSLCEPASFVRSRN